MSTKWIRLSLMPVLAAAVWAAGCADYTTAPEGLTAPDAASFAKGGNETAKEAREKQDKKEKAPKIKGKKKNGSAAVWTAAVGKLPEPKNVKSEAVVDGKKDVVLENNGHYLYIPKGTVSEPTTFRIQAHKKIVDAELGLTMVAVDLKAFTVDPETGEEIDAGADGFDGHKVYLGMTHQWAQDFDASGATVLWLKPTGHFDGSVEGVEMTTLRRDASSPFVVAELDHFSEYVLAMP